MFHTPRVGPLLRRCRIEAGMTQQKLADILMVEVTFISKVETGKRRISAEMYNDWISVTQGPITAFTYIFGEGGGKVLQSG